ncbi:MAG: caspase family protein [Candidatus Marithrix sp.]
MRNIFILYIVIFQCNYSLAEELSKEQRNAVVIANFKYAGHLDFENTEKLNKYKCEEEYNFEKVELNDEKNRLVKKYTAGLLDIPDNSIELSDFFPYSDLPNALHDGCDMAKKLRELNFKVSVLLNASKKEMYSAIYHLFSKKTQQEKQIKKNINLLYFAGHGTDQGEEYYLMSSTPIYPCIKRNTYDTNISPINSGMENSEHTCFHDKLAIKQSTIYKLIHNMMNPNAISSNKQETVVNKKVDNKGRGDKPGIFSESELSRKYINFIIFDACRDGNKTTVQKELSVLKKQQPPNSTFFSFATELNEVAGDGNDRDRNGRYTKHLLNIISTPGLPVTEMFTQVNLAVEKETNKQQRPHFINGEMMDETTFVFKEEVINQVPHW